MLSSSPQLLCVQVATVSWFFTSQPISTLRSETGQLEHQHQPMEESIIVKVFPCGEAARAGDISTPITHSTALHHLCQPELQTPHSVQSTGPLPYLSNQSLCSWSYPLNQFKFRSLTSTSQSPLSFLSSQPVKLIAATFTCNIRGIGKVRVIETCFLLPRFDTLMQTC